MNIRKMEYKDVSSICCLMNQLNKDLDEDFIVSEELIEQHFHEMNLKSDIYENSVVEIGEQVIGFISLIFYRSFFHKKGTALINELIVDHRYRSKGIGKKLIEYAMNKAKEKEMDEIEVGVMKENVQAIKFYKNCGINVESLLLGMEFED